MFPQVPLAMVVYASLFLVPWLYAGFKESMDFAVYEATRFLAALIAGCERASLVLAAVAGVAGWSLAESAGCSLVVRVTGGLLAGLAALIWRTAVA